MPDRIDAFVEAVGAEIRWKKARSPLTEEIRTHLLDQRDAYMAQGMDEDKAQTEAVRQMGDPAMLGADLDRVHRPRPQWGLLLMALVLTAAGAFLRYSLTADVPYISLRDRQMDLLGGLVGAAALAAGYLLDVSALGRRAWWACAALGVGFLCFLPWRVSGPAWLSAQLLAQWIGPADTPAWAATEGFTLQQAVPEMDGDALLVNLICTWGWLPFLVLVGAFLAFFLWLLWKTIHLRQTLGRAVCLAVLTTLAVQALASLSLTLGVPVLPGGFPLVVGNVNTAVDLFLIGLALSSLRDGGLPETAPAVCRNRSAAFRRVRWENGELILSLRPRQG